MAPSAARALAMARPMPREAPVTAMTRPERSRSIAASTHQARNGAGQPGGLTDEEALGERHALDEAEADVPDEADRVRIVREEPVEPVGRHAHRHRVEAPPALVPLQDVWRADIEPERGRVGDAFGQRGNVANAEIEALPRDRVDDMRGVADEGQSVGDEGPGDLHRQRIGAAWPDGMHRAELQSEARLKLGVEAGIVESHQPLRLAQPFRPDDGGAAAGQRQDGERAGRQEMLLGTPLMVALVLDRGDDPGLAIVPAMHRDAGLLA